jgi:hypothetical protein
MNESIAIVGMACIYPDARSPIELWHNILAQRRAFRCLPANRLRFDDYFNPDREAADCTYSEQAAVIEGYELRVSRLTELVLHRFSPFLRRALRFRMAISTSH